LNIAARPTVSMITKIRGSPINGRRKIRSIRSPKTKLPPSARKKVTGMGRPPQVARARKKYAPIASNSPWAKFSTLDDLKIITKPIAEIPYRNPIDSPPISSWMKKSIEQSSR